jgi:signal transduction histidine kinase
VESQLLSLLPGADDSGSHGAYRSPQHMLALYRWLTRRISSEDPARTPWLSSDNSGSTPARSPIEVVVIRCFGLAWLALSIAGTVSTRPHPGLHGRGLAILVALIALVLSAVCTQPLRFTGMPVWQRVAALVSLTAAAAVLAALQPTGSWQSGPVFVGIVAAMRLERVTGALTLAFSLVVVIAVSVITGHGGNAISVVFTAVPWFLVMRLMRAIAQQRNALSESRVAEATAAAAAERGRLAREMHDVLAHSLSALALQLESTRLLAADRGADHDLTRAIDQAHQLAANGLQEARRAIATARGEELPGPDRIGVLADAFGEQSGLPVDVQVRGEPRELAPEARLAVYRTAQEALTNVSRHAAAERVEIELSYLPESTVLVVADHAPNGTPAPAPLSLTRACYGLTGMRERAELLGGELVAEPTDDGFRVELQLPV